MEEGNLNIYSIKEKEIENEGKEERERACVCFGTEKDCLELDRGMGYDDGARREHS